MPIVQLVDQRLHEHIRVTRQPPARSDARARLRDFDATVVELLDTAVVLQPVDIDFDLIPGQTDEVFLSFVTGRGLVALKGALTRDHGGVRFQVQDGVRVRRQRATRVDVELPVTLRRGEEEAVGTTANLSSDGVLVRTALPGRARRPHRRDPRAPETSRDASSATATAWSRLQFADGSRAALAAFVGTLT